MIVVIFSENQIIANFQKDRILKRNKIEEEDRQERYHKKIKGDLFPKKKSVILNLYNKKDRDFFQNNTWVNEKENLKKEDLVVILSPSKIGFQKIQKELKKDGHIILNYGKNTLSLLLSDYSLPKEVVVGIINHIGSSYEKVIPLIRYLETLENKKIMDLTIDDIKPFIDNTKGDGDILTFLRPLLRGHLKEASDLIDRTLCTRSVFIVMEVLKKRIEMIFQASLVYHMGITTSREMKDCLGEEYVAILKKHKSIIESEEKCKRLYFIILRLENELKSGSKISKKAKIKEYFIHITNIIQY